MSESEPHFSIPETSPTLPISLTPAQTRVYTHMTFGLKEREIAERLGITPSTVRQTKNVILRRFGVKTGDLAVFRGVANGMVQLEAAIADFTVNPDLKLLPVEYDVMGVLTDPPGIDNSNRVIGETLGISPFVVKNTLSTVYSMLGVDKRTQAGLVYLAMQRGLRNSPKNNLILQ